MNEEQSQWPYDNPTPEEAAGWVYTAALYGTLEIATSGNTWEPVSTLVWAPAIECLALMDSLREKGDQESPPDR